MSAEVRFVTRKWPPAIGGMETCVFQLVAGLSKRREVDLIELPGAEDGSAPGAWALVGFGVGAAWRILRSKSADVVHVSDVASWPLAWIAALRHRSSRIVISAHGSDLSFTERPGWRPRLYRAYVRTGARLLRRRSLVIANSEWIAALARQSGFKNVIAVPLATEFTTSIGLNPNNGHLFFAGRIAKSKGLAFVVKEVLPLLPDHIRLRVAGTVWEQSEARVLQSDRVDYLGSLSADQLAVEFASSLCTLVPSLGPEGFGLVAVEAAVAGGVVIASNHSGLAEAVAPGIGFLEPAGDARAWAARISLVASWSPSERERFSGNAAATARALYNWDRVVSDTLRAYDQMAR